MLDIAKVNLDRFGDRVEYRLLDMTDLAGGAIPAGVNVITTSRAAHHLDRDGLFAFYAQAAALLAPGGWLVNLDHTGPADVWDARLRAVRKQFVPPASGRAKHHHNYPLTSADDHLEASPQRGSATSRSYGGPSSPACSWAAPAPEPPRSRPKPTERKALHAYRRH